MMSIDCAVDCIYNIAPILIESSIIILILVMIRYIIISRINRVSYFSINKDEKSDEIILQKNMITDIPENITSAQFEKIIPLIAKVTYVRIPNLNCSSVRYVAIFEDGAKIECSGFNNKFNCVYRLPTDIYNIKAKTKVLDSGYFWQLETLYKYWVKEGVTLENRKTPLETYIEVGPKLN